MSTNGKWILRPGKRPIIPEAVRPKTARQFLDEQEAAQAKETAKAERKADKALPPIVRMSKKFGVDRRRAFLEAYRRGGNAFKACGAVKVTWDTYCKTREADAAFKAQCDAAMIQGATERLERFIGQATVEVGADKAAAVVAALNTTYEASVASGLELRTWDLIRKTMFTLHWHGDEAGAEAARAVVNETLIRGL